MPRTTGAVVFSTEYCAGFVDVHGQWNNGFYCPKWGDPDVPYCCGDEHERYCCTSTQHPHPHRRQQQQSYRQPHYHHQQLTDQPPTDVYSTTLSFHGAQHATEPIYYHILLVGFVVGTLILLTSAAVIMCYYCRCCLVYRHRKRSHRRASRHLVNGREIAVDVGYPLCIGRTSREPPAEMIALRPPSYHTIEDPPPYPGDDADDCQLPMVGVKRPLQLAENTMTYHGHLANSGELHEDAEYQIIQQPVRQFRDAAGCCRPPEPTACVTSHDGLVDDGFQASPLISTITWRCRNPDASTRKNNTEHQSWRYEQLTFDLSTAEDDGIPFSPCRTTVQANTGSQRPNDRSVGVPYSITCPSRFDGCLQDAVGRGRPVAEQRPRPSTNGDPVTSAARDRTNRPQSHQVSSVFEISSYIITRTASNSNTSVQPSVAIQQL